MMPGCLGPGRAGAAASTRASRGRRPPSSGAPRSGQAPKYVPPLGSLSSQCLRISFFLPELVDVLQSAYVAARKGTELYKGLPNFVRITEIYEEPAVFASSRRRGDVIVYHV